MKLSKTLLAVFLYNIILHYKTIKLLTPLLIRLTLLFFIMLHTLNAQMPVQQFKEKDTKVLDYLEFKNNKTIPKEIEKQALLALSFYPELKDTKIIFRLKKRNTPLTSRPRILSVFRGKKKRAYVITISSQAKDYLDPILFSKLPYNAQVGVLGHEIGHIIDYKKKSSFQLIGLSFKLFNADFVDSFEFNTDQRTIEHGLGYQLLDWSIFVRKALGVIEWKGASVDLEAGNLPEAKQRYMNPQTIRSEIQKLELYNSNL